MRVYIASDSRILYTSRGSRSRYLFPGGRGALQHETRRHPRLSFLARPLAATKGEGFGRRALSAVSFRRSDVIFVTSPRFAEKLQIKNLSAARSPVVFMEMTIALLVFCGQY